jgi:3-hydroxyisobutyrate dehydrogenase-like beta-hydroxyacid dehydrogenase
LTQPAVALLGLGEAGSRLATDLAAAGLQVRGYDPDTTVAVAGIDRTGDPESAVSGSDVVLSVNSARIALAAAESVLSALRPGALFADVNTALPELKRDLATLVSGAGARFADVALLGPVPTRGLATPALASGSGARLFADVFGPLGMPVDVVSEKAGDAAAMKLVRSVFMKGLAAAVLESLEAAEAAGHEAWLREEIASVVGAPLLERLLDGSRRHAARRTDEMEAARELLLELGVEPRVATASVSLFGGLAAPAAGAATG